MNKIFNIHNLFILLWLIALTLFLILAKVLIDHQLDEYSLKFFVPFGVLISAMLASVSLMKSIQNTNRIEDIKEKQNIKKNRVVYSLIEKKLKLNIDMLHVHAITIKEAIDESKKDTLNVDDFGNHIKFINTIENNLNDILRELTDKELAYYHITFDKTSVRISKYYALISQLIVDINYILMLSKNDISKNTLNDVIKSIIESKEDIEKEFNIRRTT